MPIPYSQKELLDAVRQDSAKLLVDLDRIPLNLFNLKTMEGHKKDTLMSPHNLCSYLVGWGNLVLKWEMDFQRGKSPIFPHENFKWTELGDLASHFYSLYQEISREELVNLLKDNVQQIEQLILSNSDLYERIWYKHYTMGRMIQLNTSSPYKNARIRVRKWLKQNDNN